MTTPNKAKLEIKIQIDTDIYSELRAKGYTQHEVSEAIEKSITFKWQWGNFTPPIHDIEEVTLVKYY
jgi:hypothetical protein